MDKLERILVIGATGLLGNRMVQMWAKGHELHGTYLKHNANFQNSYSLDVTQKDEVIMLIRKIKPNLIVDTHGISSVDYCESHKEEASCVNVDGAKNVAEGAKESGAKYVFISTDAVFDGQKAGPYTELDEPRPINHYGLTKMQAERAILAIDPDNIIVRTSTLFGNGGQRQPPPFSNWVMDQLGKKQFIEVVTDQYSNPTYTDNLCEFVLGLHEKGATGIFHAAGRDILSRFEFANKIAEAFRLDKGLISPITTEALGQRVKKPLRTGLDISKAEKATSVMGMGVDEALAAFKKAV